MPVTIHSGYWNPSDHPDTLNNGVGAALPAGGYTPGKDTTAFNLGNSDQIKGISDLINSINLKAQQAANENRIPGAVDLEKKSSANIGSELAGQVPKDVMELLQQQAAERGVGSGVGADSPNANSAYLKALGLTSIERQKSGQADLSAADARNPGAPLFDASSQLVTPYQGTSLGLQQQQISNSALNAQTQAQLAAQENALRASSYRSPSLNYGGNTGTTTGTTGPTGSSVFPPDQPTNTDGGWGVTWSNPNYSPFQTGVDPNYSTGYQPWSPDIIPSSLADANSWQTGESPSQPGYEPFFGQM